MLMGIFMKGVKVAILQSSKAFPVVFISFLLSLLLFSYVSHVRFSIREKVMVMGIAMAI